MAVFEKVKRCAPTLCFAGAFSLVLAFFFAPTDVWGRVTVPLSDVTRWAAVSVTVLLVCSCACLVCALFLHRHTFSAICTAFALIGPVLGLILSSFMPATQASMAANALLSASAVAQLYLCADVCHPLSSTEISLGTSVALLLGLAIEATAVSLGGTPLINVRIFGTALLICGLALCLFARRAKSAKPEMDSGAKPPANELFRELRHLRYDWRSLLGCGVCALLFGSALGSGGLVVGDNLFWAPLVGRFAGAVVLIVAFALQWVHPRANYLMIVALVAVGVGVLTWPIINLSATPVLGHTVMGLSQVLFLGLLFVETQLTGHDTRLPPLMTIAGFTVFLLAWGCGVALGTFLPAPTMLAISHILFIACLCVLLVSATHAYDAEAPARKSPNYAETLRDTCRTLSERYELSDREKEVLPMLALGLSASSIADRLVVSPYTVKTYVRRIYAKMGIHSHEELVEMITQE